MAIETFKATTIHPGHGTKVRIVARQHEIISDEPEELNGTDTGANPVELLLGALGACQSVVAQVYAEKFGISFNELRIELEGDLDLDGFLDAADVRSGYSEIRVKYHLKSEASEERIAAFIEYLNDHCPVGDTIANSVNLIARDFVVHAPEFA